MISGTVNPRLEPVVEIMIAGPTGKRLNLKTVIDTGFNRFLSLTRTIVSELELKQTGLSRGALANGRVELFGTFKVSLEWDGRSRIVDVIEMDATPLLGMQLLHGTWLTVHCIDGGSVSIEAAAK